MGVDDDGGGVIVVDDDVASVSVVCLAGDVSETEVDDEDNTEANDGRYLNANGFTDLVLDGNANVGGDNDATKEEDVVDKTIKNTRTVVVLVLVDVDIAVETNLWVGSLMAMSFDLVQ
jgi:hypothetical protein